MQTSARYQAILELLDEVFQDKTPADVILNRYLRARKYIGSKDRRFITDTLWDIIRHRLRLSFDAQSTKPRDILLTYLKNEDFDIITGGPHGLEPLTDAEKHRITHIREDVYPFNVELECPDWLFQKINNPALISSLNQQAT
ncbi:MAG: hypothetical protein J6X42_06435, partial [Alphaproteobacteria bacterium]|nr:hypothetical protein [Alphaproteobacteria bacterium]